VIFLTLFSRCVHHVEVGPKNSQHRLEQLTTGNIVVWVALQRTDAQDSLRVSFRDPGGGTPTDPRPTASIDGQARSGIWGQAP